MNRLALRLLLAQGADVVTFLFFYVVIGAKLHSEKNPLLLTLMALGGIWAVAVVKMSITALVCWRASVPMGRSRVGFIARFHDRHPRVVAAHRVVRVIGLSTATASGIIGAGFNLAAIIR